MESIIAFILVVIAAAIWQQKEIKITIKHTYDKPAEIQEPKETVEDEAMRTVATQMQEWMGVMSDEE